MKSRIILLLVFIAGAFATKGQIITTIAGGGTSGLGDGGPATSCEFDLTYNTAIDATGNIYITDEMHNRIRKVTTDGIITTIAGNGTAGFSGDGGPATNAQLGLPFGIAVDGTDNVYFSDNGNHCIRKISTTGIITTVAGTGGVWGYNGDGIAATAAELYSPHGIAFDRSGNLLICDALNQRLRKVDMTTGIITTVAGTGVYAGYSGEGGPATAAVIARPFGVAIDISGNIFVAVGIDSRICKINTEGIITTIAGTSVAGYNGDNIPATSAELNQPFDVDVDVAGNVYITDAYNFRIRKINNAGIITTIAGTGTNGFSGDGGPATAAEIYPFGLTLDGAGNIFIADGANSRIRYIESTLLVNVISIPSENLDVYPNPSHTGNFRVNVSSKSNYEIPVVVTDLMGKKINEISSKTNSPFDINLDLPSGVYFLSAITGNEKVTRKLVVQR